MIILCDTREQRALKFECNGFITAVRQETLPIGDYTCEFKDGHRPSIYFERKSIPDLYSTFGKGYKRFKNNIDKTQKMNANMFIIVEGTLTKVLKGHEYSMMEPVSLIYRLFTIWIKHGIQTIYCRDRNEMVEYITQTFIACGKEYVRNKPK